MCQGCCRGRSLTTIYTGQLLNTICSHQGLSRLSFLKNSLSSLSLCTISMLELRSLLIFSHKISIWRASKKSGWECLGNRKGKKLISKNFINSKAMFWIFLKSFCDEILCRCGESNMIWKSIIAHLNPIVCSLHIICLKRGPSNHTGIGNNS